MLNAVLLPIGRSPIHCLRIARCFSKNGTSLIILAVTKETKEFGKTIQEIESGSESEYLVSEYTNACSVIKSRTEVREWNLVFGPGTRDMQVGMWHDVISVTGNPPKHWVDHRRKSSGGQGGNISSELLINLSNRSESYELDQASEEDALKLTPISIERYSQIKGLAWLKNQSKFHLHISLPANASEMKRKEARKWEENVYHRVKKAWNTFGRHALKITRDPLPSLPAWWSNIGERLRDFGIGGGSK